MKSSHNFLFLAVTLALMLKRGGWKAFNAFVAQGFLSRSILAAENALRDAPARASHTRLLVF
jgi:hypothetical protein